MRGEVPAPGCPPTPAEESRVNPRNSVGQRTPDLLYVSTVPWWEAIPWAGRTAFAGVRRIGFVERLCSALAIECLLMVAFAVAGLVFRWGQ
jgi:hypothetical protein